MILRANDSCRGDKTNVSPDIVVPASDGGKVAVGAVRLAPRSGGDTGRPRSRPGMIGLPSFVTMLMLLLLLLLSEQCVSGQRLLVDVHDSISEADMNVDGACVDGCTRQVVEGVGAGSGETDCDLRVLNLLDHVDGDVQGGTLSIVHSCTDSSNSLRYQVRACLSEGLLRTSLALFLAYVRRIHVRGTYAAVVTGDMYFCVFADRQQLYSKIDRLSARFDCFDCTLCCGSFWCVGCVFLPASACSLLHAQSSACQRGTRLLACSILHAQIRPY